MKRTPIMIVGRILTIPAVFLMLFITHNIWVIHRTYMYCRYGGGMVLHDKDELKSIQDIWNLLKEKTEL
jgi:hypothetical protein